MVHYIKEEEKLIDWCEGKKPNASENTLPIQRVVLQSEQFKAFVTEVAEWEHNYSSTRLRLMAKELLKGF